MTEQVYVFGLRGVRIEGELLKKGQIRLISKREATPLLSRETVRLADDGEVKKFLRTQNKTNKNLVVSTELNGDSIAGLGQVEDEVNPVFDTNNEENLDGDLSKV